MTQLSDALSCLADIHAHLAKGEVYRGLQAKPVFLSGFAGLCFASLQTQFVLDGDATGFLWYWLIAAGVCFLIGASGAILSYIFDDDELARRRARIVAGQFAPCLAAGFFLSIAVLPHLEKCVGLLPGIWCLLYALGLFSARPYLPHAIGWVGFYFLVAGSLLVNLLPISVIPSPWSIAFVFGIGQAGLAWVLHRNAVRESELG